MKERCTASNHLPGDVVVATRPGGVMVPAATTATSLYDQLVLFGGIPTPPSASSVTSAPNLLLLPPPTSPVLPRVPASAAAADVLVVPSSYQYHHSPAAATAAAGENGQLREHLPSSTYHHHRRHHTALVRTTTSCCLRLSVLFRSFLRELNLLLLECPFLIFIPSFRLRGCRGTSSPLGVEGGDNNKKKVASWELADGRGWSNITTDLALATPSSSSSSSYR